MFEEISNPPKGKGKERDVGKRRAYVRVVTSLGSGSLNLELYCEKVGPLLCISLLLLCLICLGSQNVLQLFNARSTRKI